MNPPLNSIVMDNPALQALAEKYTQVIIDRTRPRSWDDRFWQEFVFVQVYKACEEVNRWP